MLEELTDVGIVIEKNRSLNIGSFKILKNNSELLKKLLL